MIERQNILELLGRDSNKYHSCLITSYSFDFLYFEQRILPTLRAAGILNINMFLDANMLDQQLESSAGRHLHAKKSYSITPVQMVGAFHPKILMAVGKKKGFLAVGSGNFTTSGMTSNDEIWSAFSLSEADDLTNPIFKHVIDFFRLLQPLALATNQEKVGWIAENSSWYGSMITGIAQVPEVFRDEEQFRILSTRSDSSFYQTLLDTLPTNPTSLKILSPYYNEDGAVIKSLIRDLNPDAVHAIVDPKHGTVPHKMDSDFPVQISDWNLLTKEERYKNARLHAKAFQFEYPGQTFFLFGSPNATEEALGTSTTNARNAELAILVSASGGKDFFSELGIQFPQAGNFSLKTYKPRDLDNFQMKDSEKLPVRLLHCELESNSMVLYIVPRESDQRAEIKAFDADGTCVYSSHEIAVQTKLTCQIPPGKNESLFKAALFSKAQRISNFALVHQVELLNRTNPDNRLTRFNELLNSEQFTDVEFYELLEYARFKDKRAEHASRGFRDSYPVDGSPEDEATPEKISEEEFNLRAAEISSKDSMLRKQITLIEEFLHNLSFGSFDEKEDVSDSSESKAKLAGDQGIDSDVRVAGRQGVELSFEAGSRLRNLLHRKLNEITQTLQGHKQEIAKAFLRKEEYDFKASLDEIQALLIGCHLILLKINKSYTEQRSLVRIEFFDKKLLHQLESDFPLVRCESQKGNSMTQVSFTIDEKAAESLRFEVDRRKGLRIIYLDGTPSQITYHLFFEHKGWPERKNYSALEKFITEGIGGFLLLLLNGIESYTDRDLERWELYKERLFFRVLLILNIFNWGDNVKEIREILLLQIFHSLCPSGLSESELRDNIYQLADRQGIGSILIPNSVEFSIATLRNYRHWLSVYQNDVQKLKEDLDHWKLGRTVFNKRLGFAVVHYYSADKTVHLETPLGFENKNAGFVGFPSIFIGLKPVFYTKVTK
jgi:hypothetical protein